MYKETTTSKKETAFIVIFVLLFTIGVGFVAYKVASRQPSPESNVQQPAAKEPEIREVRLDNNTKDPISVSIASGDYIEFTSADNLDHQIVQAGVGEHGSEDVDSGTFGAGKAYRVQFKDEGVFVLKDNFNPELVISVEVTK